MTKYGFDYFANRVTILQEHSDLLEEGRGRPNPWRSEGNAGDIAADVFKQAVTDMGKGGEIPVPDLTTGKTKLEHVPGLGGNRPVNRALRYMIYILSKMDVSDEGSNETSIGEDAAKKEITDQATSLLGIPREGWTMLRDEDGNKKYGDPDKLYRAAIVAAIRKYSDYITSPEFKEKAYKPENSISYAHQNRLPTAASAIKANKRGQHHGGMSAEDMDRIETSDKDVRNLIHTAIGADKRRNKSLLNPEDPEEDDAPTLGGVSNSNIDNAYLATDALEILIDNGKDIKERINSELGNKKFANREQAETALNAEIGRIHQEYPNISKESIKSLFFADLNFLDELYNQYTELHDVGIDMDTFRQDVESYKQGKPKSVGRIMDLWLHEIQELQFTADMFSKHMPDEPAAGEVKKSNEEFPGYPKAVTDKYLTTPEQREQFKKWNNFRINNMMARQEKVADMINTLKWGEGEAPGELEQVRKGFEGFIAKRPHLAPKKGPIPTKKVSKKEKEEDAAFDADTYTPTDYDYPEEDEESSYIMGYMTEQISKDRFKPKGEFKDRGFKKLSYHEWITKYQQ